MKEEPKTFNSLFEMQELQGDSGDMTQTVILSILYLRCYTSVEAAVRDAVMTFNSLFEMHR